MEDLNGEIEDFPTVDDLVQARGWQDLGLGAQASKWGGVVREFTCLTATATQPMRRDYVLANQLAAHTHAWVGA